VEDIDFFECILLLENSNKLQKIGFQRKNQKSLECIHIANFKIFKILKM
jgi:hypothetical protein